MLTELRNVVPIPLEGGHGRQVMYSPTEKAYYRILWWLSSAAGAGDDKNKTAEVLKLADPRLCRIEHLQADIGALLEIVDSAEKHCTRPREGAYATPYFQDDSSPHVSCLRASVREAIERYARDVGELLPPRPARFDVNIFAQINPPGGSVPPHSHLSAWVVGIYYLQPPAAGEGGALRIWDDLLRVFPAATAEKRSLLPFREIFPTAGTLVIFPGYWVHSVQRHLGNALRVSFPFDVTPSRCQT